MKMLKYAFQDREGRGTLGCIGKDFSKHNVTGVSETKESRRNVKDKDMNRDSSKNVIRRAVVSASETIVVWWSKMGSERK